jgi:hypothetical protein
MSHDAPAAAQVGSCCIWLMGATHRSSTALRKGEAETLPSPHELKCIALRSRRVFRPTRACVRAPGLWNS